MKTLKFLLHVDKISHEEIPKKAWVGKVLKYILFSLMLSSLTVLSSCAVGYETPDYVYGGVIVPEYDSFGVYIDPWDYGWRREHREWIHEHPHWRSEYPRHRGEHHEGDRH
jgi:hypothetical protein